MEIQLPLPLDRELPKPAYHNSLNLEKPEKYEAIAQTQDAMVLELFIMHPPHLFSATQAWRMLQQQGHKLIRDSVKRSMSNLTKLENKRPYLIKTSKRVMGEYGREESLYMLIK